MCHHLLADVSIDEPNLFDQIVSQLVNCGGTESVKLGLASVMELGSFIVEDVGC